MTLRTRLFLALAGISAVLIVPALYATDQLDELRNIAVELRRQEAAAQNALGILRTSLDRIDRNARGWVATLDPEAGRQVQDAMSQARSALDDLGTRGYEDEAGDTRALMTALDQAVVHLDTLAREARADGTVTGSELARATDHFRYLPPLLVRARRSADAVDRAIRQESDRAARRAETISRQAVESTLAALLLAFGVAAVVGLGVTRIVTRPVHRLRRSMRRVAGGDFTAPDALDYDRTDEFGDLHRTFRSMTEKLAELDRMKSEFVSMASHRLKTPVNVLNGYAEMFVDGDFGPLSELQRDAMEEIREQVRRLIEQVNKLMELSRAEAGTLTLEYEEVPVEDLLVGVQQAFAAHARQKSVDFAVAREDTAPETVEADPDRIRDELLGNLLSNAFRAVGSGDRIRVTAWGEGGSLVLEVRDDGPGIPPDKLDQIFEKFYQVEDASDELGTGLGLSIAREITRRHGGTIQAESEPGEGTVFRARIPVRRREG